VPRDLSIVGFNNQNICLMPTPSLTSVDQQIDRTITAAVDAIFTQIDRPTVTKTIMHWISPVLVVRESTGPVPAV
jgi:DNA-binding LacI/PurR family transcriptional regulator